VVNIGIRVKLGSLDQTRTKDHAVSISFTHLTHLSLSLSRSTISFPCSHCNICRPKISFSS